MTITVFFCEDMKGGTSPGQAWSKHVLGRSINLAHTRAKCMPPPPPAGSWKENSLATPRLRFCFCRRCPAPTAAATRAVAATDVEQLPRAQAQASLCSTQNPARSHDLALPQLNILLTDEIHFAPPDKP